MRRARCSTATGRLALSSSSSLFRFNSGSYPPLSSTSTLLFNTTRCGSTSMRGGTHQRDIHFWLRSEQKEGEKRTILLPQHVNQLIQAGHKVTVEKSPIRCVPDAEYAKVKGVEFAPTGSYKTAPKDVVILGLKELPNEDEPIRHTHVYFAHIYKGQVGSEKVLKRYAQGGGKLYDLEFLTDDKGVRVAAFSHAAGKVGMAMGLMAWAHQRMSGEGVVGSLPPQVETFESYAKLCGHVRQILDKAIATPRPPLAPPKVLIIGAKGRSGRGATIIAESLGIQPVCWDMAETSRGGPFLEILEHDILVNCIYLPVGVKVPPFLTKDIIEKSSKINNNENNENNNNNKIPRRKLSVIADITCDFNNPNNILPLYRQNTTFKKPTICVVEGKPYPLEAIVIDHLPSMVPNESSLEFANALIGHLVDYGKTSVWTRALDIFNNKTAPYRS